VAKALKVTLVQSIIGMSPTQEATVKALGLRHIRQTVEHDDTPTIRGMIAAVPFCLKVETASAGEPSEAGKLPKAGAGSRSKK
jgi:large subunit ribosomal protein L30